MWLWRNGRRACLRGMWETVLVRVQSATPKFLTPSGTFFLKIHFFGNKIFEYWSEYDIILLVGPAWRNWQTRGIQNPVIVISYGFDPHRRHHLFFLWRIIT